MFSSTDLESPPRRPTEICIDTPVDEMMDDNVELVAGPSSSTDVGVPMLPRTPAQVRRREVVSPQDVRMARP